MSTPDGGPEVPALLLPSLAPPPPPPPPPQLAAHRVIRRIAPMRAKVAVNIEIPILTALYGKTLSYSVGADYCRLNLPEII
jgi:hypothetical protein